MATIKVSDLSGSALDWCVAECEGATSELDGKGADNCWLEFEINCTYLSTYSPSSDWDQGGPIIEREKICIEPHKSQDGVWIAGILGDWPKNWFNHALSAESPLIAAMRCYVASKLGDEVEVPDELVS